MIPNLFLIYTYKISYKYFKTRNNFLPETYLNLKIVKCLLLHEVMTDDRRNAKEQTHIIVKSIHRRYLLQN